jgi:hypothetical protein
MIISDLHYLETVVEDRDIVGGESRKSIISSILSHPVIQLIQTFAIESTAPASRTATPGSPLIQTNSKNKSSRQ